MVAGQSAAAQPQRTPGVTVSGNVEDSTGGALVGAHITLRDSAGRVRASTASDADGHFSVSGIVPGNYVLEAESKNFEITRKDVVVSATSATPPIRIAMRVASVRESVNVSAAGGYVATEAQAGTKVELPLMETPVAVQVIPQQVLADQQTVSLVNALVNVSGVSSTNDDYGTGDSFSIRGFDALSVLYQDGIKLDEYSAGGFPQDMANVDQIEVVKGPASVLYGQAEPGGLVNVVTKKPHPERFTDIEQQVGNHQFFRTTADLNQPLVEDKLLFRFVFDGTDANSFREFVYVHSFNVYPSFSWRPNNFVNFTLQGAYEMGSDVLDNGIPFITDGTATKAATHTWIAPVKRSSNFADPGLNVTPIAQFSLKPTLTLQLAKDWPLRLQYRIEKIGGATPVDEVYAGDADLSGDLPRIAFTEDYFHHRTNQAVADLPGKFSLKGIKNTFLIGFDYYSESGAYDYNTAFPQSINIFNPIYNQPYAPPDPAGKGYNTQGWNEYGAYIQDVAELPGHIVVLGGVRLNWAEEFENYSGSYVASTSVHDRPVTPRAGVLWRAHEHLSLYTSYTSNYGASALGQLNPNGQFLPPQSAAQVELGAKTEWLNRRLTASTAVYRIIKHNVPAADPQNPAASIAIGTVRSQGVEFDLSGQVSRDVRVIGGYSYIDAVVTSDPEDPTLGIPSLAGLKLGSVPHNVGSLWGVWEPTLHSLRGFKLGVGMQTRSSEVAWEYNADPNTGFAYYLGDRIPNFFVFNLMTGFDRTIGKAHISAQINVNNLLNRRYFSNVSPFQALPGAPFTLLPRLQIKF